MTKTGLIFALTLVLAGQTVAQDAGQAPSNYPRVLIETSAGDFTVELFSQRAPLTVANFLEYVESDFYTDTVFHRVVAGFVAQGGGYDTNYKLKETFEKIPNESGNGLSNLRANVSMARASKPHSANSQFYINLADNTMLDPRPTRWGYTVFGRVIDGMTVLDDIGYRATSSGPIPELVRDVPVEIIVITNMDRLDTASASSGSPAEPVE